MQTTHAVLRFRNRETLHVHDAVVIDTQARLVRAEGAGTDAIPFDELKAVFFLGVPGEVPGGSHLSIEFDDGEVIRGIAPEYNPTASGFYLYPEDEERVARIFIVATAIVSIDVDRL